IHTVGGVVTAAQPIMVIVPDEDKLEVEAMVLNKDIGFVKAGQKVAIKVESFPYTRYGYINGTVKSISFDAIENEQLGLVYAAKIEPERDFLNIDGAKIKLTAGMNVTGEIKTGKRRVIDYLLSPLKTKVDESLKER
ncbi:MAG: HlyD family efflux transporter periplasmic adaptor subunit, partial [Neisseriaceae bacterium]|nr:HlyD family efflux transporter periplasmic adaptor subunit [Neisseriaceae bacterium]